MPGRFGTGPRAAYAGPVTDHDPHAGHAHGLPTGPLADASVRHGRPTDAPAVGLVQATVWTDRYAARLPQEVLDAFTGPAFTAVWRRSLSDGDAQASSPGGASHRLLVACAGEQVVGFASSATDQGATEVLDLGVHPDARRAGHGSRLLNAVADTARSVGSGHVFAWIPADDDLAREFAQQAGLEPDGAWRDSVVGPQGQTIRQVRLVAAL